YMYGVEIANGFDELTDGELQEKRFIEESIIRAQKGMNEYPLDAHFLVHLKKGMPQTSGIALGVDRFVMILLSKNNIKDVILFPDGFF
ncbi:MAG TPA: aspartate--tRNA ligase, partial [Exilispira sp.]|nr:aspartate--tRNA ligase [Exilispira sp.]